MKVHGLLIVLSCTLFLCFPIKSLENSWNYGNERDVLEKWMKLDKKLKHTMQSALTNMMPLIMESSGRVNLTSQCMTDALQLINGLQNLEKWAFNFLDSSAKSLDGVLSGSITNLGDYDQCLESIVPSSIKNDSILFRGQYCMVHIYPPIPPKSKRYKIFDELDEFKNFSGTEVVTFLTKRAHLFYYMPISFGVCIPSSCTEDDLSQILKVVAEKYYLRTEVHRCEVKKNETKFMAVQIFAIFCSCTLLSMVSIGTFLEKRSIENESKLHAYFKCFSIINNFKKITSTKTAPSSFPCIHGIRFLSTTWIIFLHTYFFSVCHTTNIRMLESVQKIGREPFAQTIFNASVAVDTFFFMSGLLVCYLNVKEVKLHKKKFSIWRFVNHRLWRLAPVYYFLILFTFLVPLMGSGPVFQDVMSNSFTPCFTEWWKNLLFINNFSDSSKLCMGHQWYVACDLQLYLASLLVLLPMFQSQKIGIAINVLIVIVSIVYTGAGTYLLETSASISMIFFDATDRKLSSNYFYGNPLTRAGPYFIGTLVGYILVTRPDIKIPKEVQIIGWCLATTTSTLVLYSTAIWFNIRTPSKVETLLYDGLYNVAFTAGVAWMTFCCIIGRGGFINRILSWKAWMPLSKLTFSAYLIQPMFQIAFISVFRSTQEFSHLIMIVQAFGFMCISLLLAFILNLLVESPFQAMEKLIFQKKSKTFEDANKDKDIGLVNDNTLALNYSSNYTSYPISQSVDSRV